MTVLLKNRKTLSALEEKGRKAIAANIGASEKYTDLILQNLESDIKSTSKSH
jgi:hypothetical protein